jgi:hypothetical protein
MPLPKSETVYNAAGRPEAALLRGSHNMSLSEAVQNQLRRAIATHNLILELHPTGTFKDTTRNKMFQALCDLAIEHLGEIILLAKTDQHFGSAFALLRPLIGNVEWTPKLRQANKTYFPANGELCHGSESTEVHAGV